MNFTPEEKNLNVLILCGRKAPHKYKYKAEGYPLFSFDRMINDYIMTNELPKLIMVWLLFANSNFEVIFISVQGYEFTILY